MKKGLNLLTSRTNTNFLQMDFCIGSCFFKFSQPVHSFYLQSCLRIDFNSLRRFGVVLGYAIFSSLNTSRIILETINLAFSLSSAGTTYQGACWVLVAFRHSSKAFM